MYHGFHGFYGFHHGFWLIATIITVIPFWRICDRAGLSPWLSLLLFIPLANIIFVYYLAFAEWPAHRGSPGGTPPGFGPTPGPTSGPSAGPGPAPG
jgi:hypothetical protein